ncbi:peptidoglycan DD-metalloendopeptidase family protein [Parafilimonas sp.]|uniref:peptidoglycan DD-metalloendopeptidase family protein n=1 Tax=Parafilimonas sp. TaxID=1969739 RepID=UPI0039E411DA
MKRFIIITALLFLFNCSNKAQQRYPQGYFRNPLDIPMQLAANFGELRTDHFHMGLDIRTQSRENLPVHAAADGYVSRVKIEKYGYGHAIYITHPNGYTTLYAHLNSFYPALEKYLRDKQYKDQSWEQDFELPANLFPVTKGQFIANSGNTGGSQGPHLHFEIRDTKTGNNLNPLLFGMPLQDNIPPIIYGLYWYDRRYSAYTVLPQPISIIKTNGVYTTTVPVIKLGSPMVSLGLRMEDMNNASSFKFGVYHAALYVDDALQFEFKINDFLYPASRYVNAGMDYKRWVVNKQGIQYLFRLPGNKLSIFTPLDSDGNISLSDEQTHKIKIVLSDEKQNTSTISFSVKYDAASQKNYSIPANATVCDANSLNNIKTAGASIHFDENAFYDALPLNVYETASAITKQVSPAIHIGDYTIPVHDDYNVMIKASPLNSTLKNKVVMELKSGLSTTVKKGLWQNDWIISSFDELGDVRLLIDDAPPVIVPVSWKDGAVFIGQKTLTVKCTDDVSSIASFTAMLDGNWLMFAKKSDYFTYTFDEHCPAGKHELTITAMDVAGNATIETYTFTKQ